MSNNSVDVCQTLKQITRTNIFDENDKAIRVRNSFVETVIVSGSTTAGSDCLIVTNNSTVVPYFSGFRPGSFYTDHFYLFSSLTMTVDIYYIDFNYDEQVYRMTTTPNVYVQIPFFLRHVNKTFIISGNTTGTAVVILEPVSIYPSGYNFIYTQNSQGRAFFGIYMVPRNRKIRLSSIDYYRNISPSTLSLLCYPKYDGTATSSEEPDVVYQFYKVDGILTLDTPMPRFFTEGEVVVWFSSNTTSTLTTINSTFESFRI